MKAKRLRVLKAAVSLAAAAAGMHLLSALTLDRRLHHHFIQLSSSKLPSSLEGYTMVFLTDIHDYPPDKLREMVGQINRHRVDLVLLGGDFPSGQALARCLGILSEIRACDGFYGVCGNHDSPAALRSAMEARDMVLLENRGVSLYPGLYLGGVEDLRHHCPDVSQALEGSQSGDYVLLLGHDPDIAMEQDLSGVDLLLSGHTHGGEARLFGLWAPAAPCVTRYGQTLISGWAKSAAGTDVFVSHGIGCHLFRAFTRPQVIYLTLHSVRQSARSDMGRGK